MRNLNSLEPQDANKNQESLLKRLARNSTVKAALLGGGLLSTSAAVSACTNQVDDEFSVVSNENVGTKKQALSLAGWETPVSPSFQNPSYAYSNANAIRSGNNIKLILQSNQPGGTGGIDLWVVGSNDGGVTWNSPNLKEITNVNTSGMDAAPVYCPVSICGTDKLFLYQNGISECDYDYANDIASNCTVINGQLNVPGGSKFPTSFDNTYLYYVSAQDGSTNANIYRAKFSDWVGEAVTSANTAVNDDSVYVGNNFLLVETKGQTGNLGLGDIYAFDWDGNTASNPVNLNNITGSSQINSSYNQGGPKVDSQGDLWYSDNSSGKVQIMWAKKKQVTQTCNNGVVEGTEACDGTNLNNKACTDYGYTGGSLSCNSDCTMNTSACTNTPDGGTGGSAGTGGAGGSEAGVGGSAGEAGSAGMGGSAGSEAGVGGSAGEGGAAGTGGSAGSEAGVGGSAGEGGSAGTGGTAGSEAGVGGSAGEGGAAGTGGSAGSEAGVGGSAGEAGSAGQGGSGPDCFAKVDNTTNCSVKSCSPSAIELNVGSKKSCNVEFNGMTQKILVTNDMPSDGSFSANSSCITQMSPGTWMKYSETPAAGECHMSTDFRGTFVGTEGSSGSWLRPLTQFNPCVADPAQDKCKGRSGDDLIDYLTIEQTEATAYVKDNASGTAYDTGHDNGSVPAGTAVHFRFKNGKLSNTADPAPDPNQGVDVPPQQVSDGGGCSVCSIKTPGEGQDSTRNALMAMGLVAALAMSRRRR